MKIIPSWLISMSIHAALIFLLTFATSAFFRQKYEKAKPMPVYEAYIALSRGDGRAAGSNQFPQSDLWESNEENITFPKVDAISEPIAENRDRHSFSGGSSEIDIGNSIGAGSTSKLSHGKAQESKLHAPSPKGGGGSGGTSSATVIISSGGVNPPPPYPEIARRSCWEGRVVVRAKISSEGRVESVEVIESSGYDILDKAAADTIAKWLFEPAKLDGVPVESSKDHAFRFKLK